MILDPTQVAAIRSRAAEVNDRIAAAARSVGRDPSSITLVAVTKTHPLETVVAAAAAGLTEFGENYAQEAASKIVEFGTEKAVRWHFIGNLQSNKASLVTGNCALIHTIDRPKIASVISKLAVERGVVQDVLVQARLGDEPTKSGADLADVPALCDFVASQPGLRLRGLMGIAPLTESHGNIFEESRYFDNLKKVFDCIIVEYCDILSMGMSGDYEKAIASGSTLVRIGSALFGARDYSDKQAG
ncbi:MAG TPA: YggS family pyridoxal phosphate-dependent enzyme [Capsulimonadaceae bacterium]|jgi:hypothetical protein